MESILRVNQAVSKPDEPRSLLSTFQARWSGTRVENVPVQYDPDSRFGLVFEDEELGTRIVPFDLDGVNAGLDIRTPTNEDRERLPEYEVTSGLEWNPQSPEHARAKRADYRGCFWVTLVPVEKIL